MTHKTNTRRLTQAVCSRCGQPYPGVEADAPCGRCGSTSPTTIDLDPTTGRQAPTTAAWVASLLGNDGTRWRTTDDRSLDDLAREASARIERVDGQGTGYTFPDGSRILAAEGAWDLAFPRCWCWHGAGHQDDCPEAGTCSLPGCERPSYAAPKTGPLRRLPLCEAHFRRSARGSASIAPVRARGTERLVPVSTRLPKSVADALGTSKGSALRRIAEEWAKARKR